MTNALVGEVYAKIIEDVIAASSNDFEESGVGSTLLGELQQDWQTKLSARNCAQMPWDPKPAPPVVQAPSNGSAPTPTSATPVPAPSSYTAYETSQGNNAHSNPQIKTEPGADGQQLNGGSNGNYAQGGLPAQGGITRAQQLIQQQYGNSATATINAMQQRGGLALPGQQAKPQGYQMPSQGLSPAQQQQQFAAQQHAAMQRQQQQLQQQQQAQQPRVKMEADSPQINQGSSDQKPPANPAYAQTDGADEALEEWRAMLAQRRADGAEKVQYADRMMYNQIMQLSEELSNGLLLPTKYPKRGGKNRCKSKKRRATERGPAATPSTASAAAPPAIPQLDGDADDDDEKPDVKDDVDDADAINSDLDDPDDDDQGSMNDDDDELIDQILCTYDKVQRVKNKWKCTLKDGAMSVKGRDWVFHKGMGEFEW